MTELSLPVQHEGSFVVVYPERLSREVAKLKRIVFGTVFVIPLVVLGVVVVLVPFQSKSLALRIVLFILASDVLAAVMITQVMWWFFPVAFDPVGKRQIMLVPVFRRRRDLAQLRDVFVCEREVRTRNGIERFLELGGRLPSGKEITLLRLPTSTDRKLFVSVARQVAGEMGWRLSDKLVQPQ